MQNAELKMAHQRRDQAAMTLVAAKNAAGRAAAHLSGLESKLNQLVERTRVANLGHAETLAEAFRKGDAPAADAGADGLSDSELAAANVNVERARHAKVALDDEVAKAEAEHRASGEAVERAAITIIRREVTAVEDQLAAALDEADRLAKHLRGSGWVGQKGPSSPLAPSRRTIDLLEKMKPIEHFELRVNGPKWRERWDGWYGQLLHDADAPAPVLGLEQATAGAV